jgi:cell division protein FtsX
MVKQVFDKFLAMEWAFTKFVMPILGLFFAVAVTVIGFMVKAQLATNKEMSATLTVMVTKQAVGNVTLTNIDKTLQGLQKNQEKTDERVTAIEKETGIIKGDVKGLGVRLNRVEQDFREAKNGY